MRIPLNKEKYSEESKRSVGYEYLESFYSDIEYDCLRCKKREIFSAKDQKYTFEVKKAYMWVQRVLCKVCWKEERLLKNELQLLENEYCLDKKLKLNDKVFLQKWLNKLEVYVTYGAKGSEPRAVFIKKHLTKA